MQAICVLRDYTTKYPRVLQRDESHMAARGNCFRCRYGLCRAFSVRFSYVFRPLVLSCLPTPLASWQPGYRVDAGTKVRNSRTRGDTCARDDDHAASVPPHKLAELEDL